MLIDKNLDRLRWVDQIHRGRIMTLASNRGAIERSVADADLVIGAVLVAGGRAPVVVSEDLVQTMKPQAVIVDVAIDQGGCIETIHETTHDEPTYVLHDVVHYAVGNMPGAVPHTSTYALTNATLPVPARGRRPRTRRRLPPRPGRRLRRQHRRRQRHQPAGRRVPRRRLRRAPHRPRLRGVWGLRSQIERGDCGELPPSSRDLRVECAVTGGYGGPMGNPSTTPVLVTDLDLPLVEPRDDLEIAERNARLLEAAEDNWLVRTVFGHMVLRYDDVVAVLRDKRWHSAASRVTEIMGITDPAFTSRRRTSILSAEGEEHTRLRRLVGQAFSPRAADRLRPFMREVINSLVDPVAPAGRADIAVDICEPYPIPIICELLGRAPRRLEAVQHVGRRRAQGVRRRPRRQARCRHGRPGRPRRLYP